MIFRSEGYSIQKHTLNKKKYTVYQYISKFPPPFFLIIQRNGDENYPKTSTQN
jgi:hypothetical protein